MKNRRPGNEDPQGKGGATSAVSGKKKNMKRLGGGRGAGGLSLAAFANMKSNNNYNPGLIKKQREFYKNAKYVNKYKKSLKRMQNESSTANSEEKNSEGSSGKMNNARHNPTSLQILYEKKREEEERVRAEREAMIKAKKEEMEKADARRKTERQKMFKKTRSGQPVMKYRIDPKFQMKIAVLMRKLRVQWLREGDRIRLHSFSIFPFHGFSFVVVKFSKESLGC